MKKSLILRLVSFLGFCIAAVACGGVSVYASTVERLGWRELLQQSQVIFRGQCTSQQAYRDPQTGVIWTSYRFRITEGFKGSAGPSWTVTEPGGIVGEMGQYVPGAPRFMPGEEVILFLYPTPGGKWRVRGLGQGHFRIVRSPDGDHVQQSMGGAELVHRENDIQDGDAPVTPAMELNRFLEVLRRDLYTGGIRR